MAKRSEQVSIAEQLVRLAIGTYRLGISDKNEPFAVLKNGPNIAFQLKGSAGALRSRLARDYRELHKATPNASALTDAITVLVGLCESEDPEPLHLRVARHGDSIVIDLGDREGRAVIIRPGSWDVVPRSPVLFQRSALTSALPVPEDGGDLEDLKQLLNVSREYWPLVVGWLVASIVPDIPHPVMLLGGIQGVGKSSVARTLMAIFDPSPAPLRCEPRDVEQWQLQASGSWGLCLDNLSGIPVWLADAICRAATGDGLVKRKLYSDSDLHVLSFRRVIVLTSIDAGALRGDLGDRLILIDLEPISEVERRTERELDAAFRACYSRIVGALFTAIAKTLAALPRVNVPRLARMADFSRILAATDLVGVTQGALDSFLGQRGRIAQEVIDGDPFGSALRDLVRSVGEWEGSASELLLALCPEDGKIPKGFPVRGSVKGRLKRLLPALATCGMAVEFDRAPGSDRRRLIRLSARQEPENGVRPVRTDPVSDTSDNLDGTFPGLSSDLTGVQDDPPPNGIARRGSFVLGPQVRGGCDNER